MSKEPIRAGEIVVFNVDVRGPEYYIYIQCHLFHVQYSSASLFLLSKVQTFIVS